ncbi:ABC-type antimicrobial peptide transport system ATPase subunit [Streptomyces albaduncus]|uniref:ABC-type antimicrobial peptide transport system ATPase subunit n=1 Tax=Streptomyces griseoloalbus TaxID=67303 RepID=A0A7W8BK13_9ACTN|nr:hypothetical protein [Streptomyces albaduncus]MBB5124852.1 ABC-type antimicrobial peptide transport system ATPase subunit [Streptomyces albaduncus]GGW39847.1 hypothetical protein GCM10010340_17270 [Streptomyces albaduncus]
MGGHPLVAVQAACGAYVRMGSTWRSSPRDLDTAALAHRIAVLDAGELVEQGPARRILTSPSHPYTVALMKTVGDPDVKR